MADDPGGGEAPRDTGTLTAPPARPAATTPRSAPGGREVLLVAVAVVALALGLAAATGLLPPAGQDLVFRTPLVIVVLLIGTIGLMVRLAMRRPPA
ncbi:MAG: hypothetical protein M3P84_12460 [Chloroflexota bacterium]|nr:hypothetical protein [Chloroflexota bacterium]